MMPPLDPRRGAGPWPMCFAAIDFETADYGPESACAVGVTRVEGGQIVAQQSLLIRPPNPRVRFTEIHGLTWADLADAPPFAEAWQRVAPLCEGVGVMVAHNAGFDRRVLWTCCQQGGLTIPAAPFACTVQLARKVWRLPSAGLSPVCQHLGIDLVHHQAGSDAEACARIVLAAQRQVAAAPRWHLGPPSWMPGSESAGRRRSWATNRRPGSPRW